jgi:hypothetical protein
MLRRAAFLLLLLAAAACQPTPAALTQPTPIPFPTMTVGRTVSGVLTPSGILPPDSSNLANPATAVALANQPTATPDRTACPAGGSATLGEKPAAGRAVVDEMLRFLSAGGSVRALEAGLRDDWELPGETGTIRADVDLTGEGAPEVLLSYTSPEGDGTLVVLGCADGAFRSLYQALSEGDTPPEILWSADMNNDRMPEVAFSSQVCAEEQPCTYQTQVMTWKPELGRFVSLLERTLTTDNLPELRDIDGDLVTEVVVGLKNRGNSETGPLRTGLNVYDWNGSTYLLSIVQYDPPRFTIQVVHEADRAFAQRSAEAAIPMYELALDDPNLEPWYNDDVTVLHTYVMYRLLLMYAYTEDERQLDLYTRMIEEYPDPAARPIFAAMSDTFWNAFQVTQNLHSACLEVLEVVAQQPDALNLINRYGSRSPTYTAQELCPF